MILELEENLDNLDEKLKQVHEKNHGVLGDIALAIGLASLDDHLGVVDDVHAGDE